VFSDGSKDLAHNLDDLRERWLLRKQEVDKLAKEIMSLPKEPDYLNPATLEQSMEWTAHLNNRIGKIQVELSALNHMTHHMDKHLWYAKRQLLIAEHEYRKEIVRQLRPINRRFNEENERIRQRALLVNLPEHVQEMRKYIHDLNIENKRLQKKIGQLQRVLYENGIALPKDEQ
jgi:DNA polymerase IIIc chi subunit